MPRLVVLVVLMVGAGRCQMPPPVVLPPISCNFLNGAGECVDCTLTQRDLSPQGMEAYRSSRMPVHDDVALPRPPSDVKRARISHWDPDGTERMGLRVLVRVRDAELVSGLFAMVAFVWTREEGPPWELTGRTSLNTVIFDLSLDRGPGALGPTDTTGYIRMDLPLDQELGLKPGVEEEMQFVLKVCPEPAVLHSPPSCFYDIVAHLPSIRNTSSDNHDIHVFPECARTSRISVPEPPAPQRHTALSGSTGEEFDITQLLEGNSYVLSAPTAGNGSKKTLAQFAVHHIEVSVGIVAGVVLLACVFALWLKWQAPSGGGHHLAVDKRELPPVAPPPPPPPNDSPSGDDDSSQRSRDGGGASSRDSIKSNYIPAASLGGYFQQPIEDNLADFNEQDGETASVGSAMTFYFQQFYSPENTTTTCLQGDSTPGSRVATDRRRRRSQSRGGSSICSSNLLKLSASASAAAPPSEFDSPLSTSECSSSTQLRLDLPSRKSSAGTFSSV